MKLPELEELYRRYRMDLYRYLCFLTHDPVQAEDLLSETFVRVIKRLPTFRGECEVKTWLFWHCTQYLAGKPAQAAPVRQPGRFDGTLHNR